MISPLNTKLDRKWIEASQRIEELEQQRDELQAKWDHYQQLCQDHNAHGIGDLIVQRDELLAALHAVRLKTDPKYGWPIIDAAIAKVKP